MQYPVRGKGAVVLFSGGQDSTTALFWALQRFSNVAALTVAYGQRHARELEAAREIAKLGDIEHIVAAISLGGNLGSSLLTNGTAFGDDPTGKPRSFVPGRNLTLLSVAAGHAYARGWQTIVIGVSGTDYTGYPDCRYEFVTAAQTALTFALDTPMSIETPLLFRSKKETVELARELPGCWEALAHSSTCYEGGQEPCGDCPACQARAEGFVQASIQDPALRQ